MKFPKGGSDPASEGTGPQDPGPAVGERPEDERPPLRLMATYGIQHILALYAGVITPPLIMAAAVGLDPVETGLIISAALLVSGLMTLLQTLGVWRFGMRMPLVIGASFIPITAMTSISESSGLPAVFGASIVAGLFGILIAPVMAGLIRFFPPVVTGSVITVLGLVLIPVAVGWITGNSETGVPSDTGLLLGGATLVIILVLSKVLRGVWGRSAILLGLLLGTLLAAALGEVDFGAVGEGPVFSLPTPFYFGPPEFQIAAIITMCIMMIVILAEGMADILAVGAVVGSKVDGRRLADGLRADAATAVIGPLLNSFPGSTFSQNIGLIALNKVKSRYVVAAGAVFLVAMGLFPILGRVVAMIPSPVLGGAGLVLFGSVAAAGIQTLGRVDYEGNQNIVIVAVSLGFGVLSIASPDFFAPFPDWAAMILHSGVVTATASALLLNVFFNVLGFGGEGSVPAQDEPADRR
ncbi:nucleobase:cation symporter-2 family protein [Nocardiopsis metallicus]|uniref:Xanthine permease n=1 Tax=Nocardiopsis metallicus TaxID=179819 RepID=A0A840W4F8_9ACTN|nr:nucleobase:cation symporter-2 family protein [Nocardiopsis metallicus]MBB5490874.1 xanthine permease [Nocardiopsis metallicus]